MTRKNFLYWVKFQGIDLKKEHVVLWTRSEDPEAMGIYQRKDKLWQLYDNTGMYVQLRGSERQVFGRLQEILIAKRQAKNPKYQEPAMTVEELYEWAKEWGLEHCPITVSGRPYPSSVTRWQLSIQDSLSREETYLKI